MPIQLKRILTYINLKNRVTISFHSGGCIVLVLASPPFIKFNFNSYVAPLHLKLMTRCRTFTSERYTIDNLLKTLLYPT